MIQNSDSVLSNCDLDTQKTRDEFKKNGGPVDKRNVVGSSSFLFKALIWCVITYFVAIEFAVNHFWVVVLSVFLFSIPIALCGFYSTTIRQIRRLSSFVPGGRLFRLISSRPLKVFLCVCWALGTSFFMLIQFHTYSYLEWIAFFLVVPVFYIIFFVSRRFVASELKTYLVTDMALVWSRRVCPLIMLAVYVALIAKFGETPSYPSLQNAINAQQGAVADMTGSALVWEVSQYLAYYDGAKAYALGRFGVQDAMLALALLGIGGFVVFYNACAILSCFLIPGVEYQRVFGPLSNTDKPQPIAPSRVAIMVAVTTFIAFFVYLPLFSYLEAWLQKTPEMRMARQSAESWLTPKLEKIDNEFFNEGTLAKIQDAKVEVLHKVEISRAHLLGQIDRAFDRMETNVDGYLDWYYSLTGEYSRIANLLVGDLEDYMNKKLHEYLQQGDSFNNVQTALDNALAAHETSMLEYQNAARKIMEQNRVLPAGNPVVTKHISLKDVLNPPITHDIISFKNRLLVAGGGGAVAGVVTTVVTTKIMGKIVGKGVVKLAAKALTKVVASKTAGAVGGATAGATVGATIGSVIPGPGTVIGATIGGLIGGLAAGVTVDKMLLMLEESLNREEFKREILSAIQEYRMEFKAGF